MKSFYSINFNARMCRMIISVNGVPLINMEIDGQCSTRYPFNNLILESGNIPIKYEVRPLGKELQLHKEAYLSCEVELFDLESTLEPVAMMARYETPADPNNDMLPFLIHEDVFHAEVPYSLVGWKNSMKLDQYGDSLRTLVVAKYESLITLMRNHDFSQYAKEFEERENIMGVCFYLSEEEKRERMEDIANAVMNCSQIVPLSNRDFFEFAADGHLVRLVREDGESSLRLLNEAAGEETIIELWLQMKQGSNELTII